METTTENHGKYAAQDSLWYLSVSQYTLENMDLKVQGLNNRDPWEIDRIHLIVSVYKQQ